VRVATGPLGPLGHHRGMGLPARALAPGEHVVLSVRTHWKALVGPVFLLFFIAALTGFAVAALPAGRYHHVGEEALAAVAAILVLRLTIWQFLQWFAETFTITDRRLAHRAGVLRKTGRDLPLSRVADVSYDRSLWDRLFRCGTLIVQTAGEAGDIVFDDVPHVDEFELALTELCYGPQPEESAATRRATRRARRRAAREQSAGDRAVGYEASGYGATDVVAAPPASPAAVDSMKTQRR
jgi:uncharacterized membrane protein YdbT with pleckstrin-like domain